MQNKFILKVIAIVTAILFGTLAVSYAFFSININGDNTKATFLTNLLSTAQVFFSAEDATTMIIDPSDLPKSEGANNYTKYISKTTSVSAKIINDSIGSESSCTYSIIYTPFDIYTPSQTTYKEYTVTGSANVSSATSSVTSTDEVNLGNVEEPIYLVKNATMTVNGAGTEGQVDWTFTFKYYNLAVNQNIAAGTRMSGKISFANISCLGGDTINKIEIDETSTSQKPLSEGTINRGSLNSYISSNYSITKIIFTNTGKPENKSSTYIGSDIVIWTEDEKAYISAEDPGKYVQAPVNSSQLFYGFANLTLIDVQYLDTSNVEEMYGMFGSCGQRYGGGLEIRHLYKFDTSKVEDMSYMFSDCAAAELDLSSFDTSNVYNMEGMFMNGQSTLTTIYVSEIWDVSGVLNSDRMFEMSFGLPNYHWEGPFDKTYAHSGAGGYLIEMPTTITILPTF